ncbi:hypothetical protein [Nostoc sp. CALU 546]|uniref:hypothetical protein n=1 Tax=Nostoc sp. CALU 546 TaxID=1867241 RepID=UPI003B681CFE
MLNNLISTISTLAKQIQANRVGIKYAAKTAGAASKIYTRTVKPAILEDMGEYYQKLEREKAGKTASEIEEIEKRQEWILKIGKGWKKKPY